MRSVILILLFTSISYSQIPYDKQLHFVAGAMTGASIHAVTYNITKNRRKAWIWSMGFVLVVGLAKEIDDEIRYKGGFDIEDLGVTLLGGLSANITFEIFKKK